MEINTTYGKPTAFECNDWVGDTLRVYTSLENVFISVRQDGKLSIVRFTLDEMKEILDVFNDMVF